MLELQLYKKYTCIFDIPLCSTIFFQNSSKVLINQTFLKHVAFLMHHLTQHNY
jgi:hypothetical protein